MASLPSQHKDKPASFSNAIDNIISTCAHSEPVNLGKSLCQFMQSTFCPGKGNFTIAIKDAYDYQIGHVDFEPDKVFSEVVALSDELSQAFQHLTPDQEAAFEDHILHCLTRMVYGSNSIEKAGTDLSLTMKLCMAIFCGDEIPDETTDEEFFALKQFLMHKNLPADTAAVLRSRREVVQHAKAASYLINQLCLCGCDLTEEIILETHRILTYKVDAATTPWTQYSGVYRSHEVSAGLHAFPHPSLVPNKMHGLIYDLNCDLRQAVKTGAIDPVALATKYAHVFINIHPFIDGNGRMCRLILNSMLLKFGSFIVCLGEQENDRLTYLDIAANASMLEVMYEDAEEEEKPKLHKELASFVLDHVIKGISDLVQVASSNLEAEEMT